MKKIINVTARDIKFGVRNDCKGCPIYRAAKRIMKKYIVAVSKTTLFYGGKFAILPQKAIAFVKDFDAGKCVKPFKFFVEIP